MSHTSTYWLHMHKMHPNRFRTTNKLIELKNGNYYDTWLRYMMHPIYTDLSNIISQFFNVFFSCLKHTHTHFAPTQILHTIRNKQLRHTKIGNIVKIRIYYSYEWHMAMFCCHIRFFTHLFRLARRSDIDENS